MILYIKNIKHHTVCMPTLASATSNDPEDNVAAIKEQVSQIGSIITIKWSASKVSGSGWKPGWYRAEVQGYSEDNDIITLRYVSEPTECYEEELTPLIEENKIQLIQSPL